MPIINRSHIVRAKGEKNTPSIAQFNALGYQYPFKGWEAEILGKEYSIEAIHKFMGVRVPGKKQKPKNRKQKKKQYTKPKPKSPQQKKGDYENPLWIEKRRQIYRRDGHRCVSCGARGKLNAHHLLYEVGVNLWEVPDYYLVSLCDQCHKLEHSKRLTPPRKIH